MVRLKTIFPFGAKSDWSLRARFPFVRTDVLEESDGFGDASLQLTHVVGMSREHGFVAQGEVTFDTASRDELGGGQDVFKATLIYARFLPHGIFAPAWVQSINLTDERGRPDVNSTTFDFYYVPHFETPGLYMTFDPALNFDWESDHQFASLAVTIGKVVGPAFGGHGQVYIKPSFQVGAERAIGLGD